MARTNSVKSMCIERIQDSILDITVPLVLAVVLVLVQTHQNLVFCLKYCSEVR